MTGLSRILSVATLAVQLMVGCCCLHHAHGCGSELPSSSLHSEIELDEQCPRCGCDHSHHGTPGCQRVKCSLVFPRRTPGGSLVRLFQASFAALPDGQLARAAVGSLQHSQASGHLLLPVRLHLANHVLLI
jgi:hypothetical protein